MCDLGHRLQRDRDAAGERPQKSGGSPHLQGPDSLGGAPRSAVTNVGMVVLRDGAAVVHRQLFRVAYVAESAVALQLL